MQESSMFPVLRVGLFVILGLLFAHIVVASVQRSRKAGALEEAWVEEGQPVPWDDYCKRGMEPLEKSLRQRLIYGVYVVPTTIIVLLTLLSNWD
jgi:hypothetical protein